MLLRQHRWIEQPRKSQVLLGNARGQVMASWALLWQRPKPQHHHGDAFSRSVTYLLDAGAEDINPCRAQSSDKHLQNHSFVVHSAQTSGVVL